MKFKQYLQEEYVTQLRPEHRKHIGGIYTIFKNPNVKEFRECGYDIRYIILFEKKEIYVWDGSSIVHWEVVKYLQDEGLLPSGEDILDTEKFWQTACAGIGKREGNKIRPIRLSDYFQGVLYELWESGKNIDWLYEKEPDWLKHWFTDSLIDSIKEYYKEDLGVEDEDE